VLGLFLAGQQRLDLSPKHFVSGAGVFEKGNAPARVELQNAVIEFFDSTPAFRLHVLSIAQLSHRRWTFTTFQSTHSVSMTPTRWPLACRSNP